MTQEEIDAYVAKSRVKTENEENVHKSNTIADIIEPNFLEQEADYTNRTKVSDHGSKSDEFEHHFGESNNSKEYMILALIYGLIILLVIIFFTSGCYKKV